MSAATVGGSDGWPMTPLPGSVEAQDALMRTALAELCEVSSARRLLADPPPPTRYVVPGLLPHGLALLYGRPKLGKSWAALELALAVAAGDAFLGHFPTERGDVFYLALEDGPSRLHERMRALLGDDAQGPPGLHFATRMTGRIVDAIRTWAATASNPRLVILDTLQKARGNRGGSGNAYADDYAAMTALKDLADGLGICLLLVHHARKGSADDGDVDAASGTFGIAGAVDTGIHLRQAVEGVTVLASWSRDAEAGEWPMRRVGPAWVVTDGPIPDPNLGDRSSAILALVTSRADQGTRAADVEADLDGVDGAAARQGLKRLADAGKITKRERGVYVPVTSVTSVTSNESGAQVLPLDVTPVTLVTPPVEGEW